MAEPSAATHSGNWMRLRPEEYKQALRVFYQHSDTHRLLAEFIERQVLPQLDAAAAEGSGTPQAPVARRMLDVGAGDASLALQLLPHFPGGVLAVDCNAGLLLGDQAGGGGDEAGGSSSTGGGGAVLPNRLEPGVVQRVVADFLQLELPPGHQFDLVLASHVLYQMPEQVIAAFLRKMWAHRAPAGGRVLVALGAPRGQLYRFEHELAPGTVTSADICRVLDSLGLPYSVTPARDERNWVGSEAELRLVLRFLAEEASLGGLAGGADGAAAAASDTAAAAPAAEQAAAVIELFVAEWPRGTGGSYLLHEDEEFILVG